MGYSIKRDTRGEGKGVLCGLYGVVLRVCLCLLFPLQAIFSAKRGEEARNKRKKVERGSCVGLRVVYCVLRVVLRVMLACCVLRVVLRVVMRTTGTFFNARIIAHARTPRAIHASVTKNNNHKGDKGEVNSSS